MKEILFKAKRIDNGEWVEGFLFYMMYDGVKICCIGCEPINANDYGDIIGCWYMVDEETVCQYTGIAGKNGVKVFDGDKVMLYGETKFKKIAHISERRGMWVVEFKKGWDFLSWIAEYVEVIGNIHDKEDEA